MAITFEVKQKPAAEFNVAGVRVIEVGTGGGEAYEGDYEVVPKAFEPVVLPTKNKLLADDVTVTKVPYYEVSNETGTTVYIASEV